jgi:NADH-quinone oxidoreductase subunit J
MRRGLSIMAVVGAVLCAAIPLYAQGADAGAAAAPPQAATGEAVAFYLLAALAAGSALGCVIATNIVRMAMCLLGTLGGVALLYFLLAANFLGVIQLIVYAGGTLIVIVFGVMLTSKTYGLRLRARPVEIAAGAIVCLALFAGLVAILVHTVWTPASPSPQEFSVGNIGSALLTTYLVPFELASVLLLAVMIGAAYLAQPVKK